MTNMRHRIAIWAVLAYLLRFVSSWAVLAWTGDDQFDRHGFGLLGDALQLSVLAPPLLGLLVWIVRRRLPWRGVLARASTAGWTILSVVLLGLIGAPTLGQVWAVRLLPVTGSWPVLVGAATWLITVAVLRAMAVSPPRRST